MIRKNVSKTIALSVALTTIIGGSSIASASEMTEEDYPWDHPYPTAEERDVENIYPSDTDTKDSWKWGEWLHCEDVMDKDFQEKLKEVGDINTYITNEASPLGYENYEYPTEEELNNLEESSWDAPGDYTYLVENYSEDEKPKLMKVKGKDKYFIATNVAKDDRDPKTEEKYFYRLFKPEDYLSKDMVEWKTDPETGEKYNAKIYNGWGETHAYIGSGDIESYAPLDYGKHHADRRILKSELTPQKGLSLSERFDFFMNHDDVFSFNTSYYDKAFPIMGSGRIIPSTRNYIENEETGKKELSHSPFAFASCNPMVTIKPASVSPIAGKYVGSGSKDSWKFPDNYLYPSDNGLTLRKTDKDNKLLSGSSWKIKNLGTKEEFTVTDNKKPSDNDKNTLEDLYKEDGLINVALPEGRYELIEDKAPEGYKIDNTPRKFVIHDRSGASFGMGAIVNEPETPNEPDTPDTPDTPHESDTPDTPDTPHESDTPDSPKTPDTPSESDTPESPKTPDTPSESANPSNPNTPDTPDTPDAPIVSPVQPVNRKPFTPVSTVSPYQPRVASDKTTPLVEEDVVDSVKVNTGGKVEKNTLFSKVLSVFS